MARHFTPKEANDELQEIRPLAEARRASRRAAAASGGARGAGGEDRRQRRRHRLAGDRRPREAEQLERVGIARCVDAIHSRGAIVKDIDEGLVDFPAVREGAEILLCWRLGEDEVAHWHGLEEGFAGRKQLDPE